MVHLDLDPERRQTLTDSVSSALCRAMPNSDVRVRGSLQEGTADPLSDIDLCWVVPDETGWRVGGHPALAPHCPQDHLDCPDARCTQTAVSLDKSHPVLPKKRR